MQQDFQDLLSPMFHGQATPYYTIHRKVVIVVASQNVHKP